MKIFTRDKDKILVDSSDNTPDGFWGNLGKGFGCLMMLLGLGIFFNFGLFCETLRSLFGK